MELKKGSADNLFGMKDDTAPAPAEDTKQPQAEAPDPGSSFQKDPGNQHIPPQPPQPMTAQASTSSGPGTALAQQAGGDRFGSLEGKLGFGAFPQVKLDKDTFVVGEEGELSEFDFKPMGSQSRWIYKNTVDDLFFSYDNVTATDGRPVEDILSDWKADGNPMKERREYQEVYGYIMSGEFAHRMVVLSIPPASVPRLAGLIAELGAMRQITLDQAIVHIEKGAKIRTKAGQTFYPWKFSFKCLVDEYVEEDAK